MFQALKSDEHPTKRQLAYVKALVEHTGRTFSWPRTRAQATAEIARLMRTPRTSRTEGTIEEIDDRAIREAAEDAAEIHGFEVVGYGSTATWRQRS